MADDVDIANDLTENEVSRALSKIRESASQNATGSKYCIECDDLIPLERQNMGYKLCVPCAREVERKKQLFID